MRITASIVILLMMLLSGRANTIPSNEEAVRLAIEGHSNATPWIAAQGSFVAVAWGATPPSGGADVYVAVSRDGARTFDSPVRVNARPRTARLGGELPPRIALSRPPDVGVDPAMTVVWGSKETRTEIRAARSIDGGKTFLAERSLSAADAAGDRGWHALTIGEHGTAHVLWLDHRRLASRPKTSHDHHGDGAEMAQFSGLYYSDGTSERELTPGVCYCCKVATATGADGSVFAAWRHVYKGNIRDIAFMLSRDGGRTFTAPSRVSEDNWQLAGCPDDGPAMAVGPDGVVHLVWPTVIDGDTPQGALFHASTRDGRTFTARQRIATLGGPKPSHPQVAALGNGRLIVAWDEVIDGVRRASARSLHITADGDMSSGSLVSIGGESASAYPVLAATDSGLVTVWTNGLGAASVINVTRLQVP
jgi:hypothetical protein